MKKKQKLSFVKYLMAQKAFLSFPRSLFVACYFFAAINVANAAQPDCIQERMAAVRAFSAHLPADPQRVKNALILQRQGEVSCRQGDTETGQAKFIQAISVISPEGINDAIANKQKGGSNE